MRVLVLFDLPVLTPENRRVYRRFRKFLVKHGFIMIQESVYSKIALNSNVAKAIAVKVRENKPEEGLVQLITITERQYNSMEFIVGEKRSDILDSDERLVIL